MKKQYLFTKDSGFTHVKSEMHQVATEHIVKDDETGRLYHHVVSYGSWFKISYPSIFMSHMLQKIGVTGFCVSYAADDSKIILPCYPYHQSQRKSLVELPQSMELKDISFDKSSSKTSEKFKETFFGKTFKKTYLNDGMTYHKSGGELLREIFGCSQFRLGTGVVQGKSYPLYCVLYRVGYGTDLKSLKELLETTDIIKDPDIVSILTKFAQTDIKKEIGYFEAEVESSFEELEQELIERQQVIKKYLEKERTVVAEC